MTSPSLLGLALTRDTESGRQCEPSVGYRVRKSFIWDRKMCVSGLGQLVLIEPNECHSAKTAANGRKEKGRLCYPFCIISPPPEHVHTGSGISYNQHFFKNLLNCKEI